MSALFHDYVVAARGEKIYSSASTTLTLKITSSETMSGSGTINAKSTTSFSSSGTLYMDSEIFTYTGVTATSFTGVTRATSSTTAAAHSTKTVISESWTERDTGRTNAAKYKFERFNFDGSDKFIIVDQANAPTVFNTSLSATDVVCQLSSTVVLGKDVALLKRKSICYGRNATPQEVVFQCPPFDEDILLLRLVVQVVKVDDTIVDLKFSVKIYLYFVKTEYLNCQEQQVLTLLLLLLHVTLVVLMEIQYKNLLVT